MRIKVPREVLSDLAGSRRRIGVGDLIRKVTDLMGIRSCDGCKRRQKSLNRFEIRW